MRNMLHLALDQAVKNRLIQGNLVEGVRLPNFDDSIASQYPGYNSDGYVFCQENGQPYKPRTYQDLFKRCVRQAGILDANFHTFRHTFATRSLEQGMDVVTLPWLLGHANPSITLDKYGHALDDHKKASIGKLGELYSGTRKTPPAPARAAAAKHRWER